MSTLNTPSNLNLTAPEENEISSRSQAAALASSALIQVSRLEKVYRPPGAEGEGSEVRALAGVDLTIRRGEFVAIMGPSGSGKSTLMQLLGLLDRPSGGTYILDGVDVSRLSDDELADLRSEKIGFIFQFFNLLPRTSCIDNVSLPMLYSGADRPRERAIELLQQVGLGERLDHKPHQLSGGQQQRVAIARSLANQPQLLFADEPTGNLSTEMTDEVLRLLENLNEQGVTIVLVTHETEVAQRARRLISVRDGRIERDEYLREPVAAGLLQADLAASSVPLRNEPLQNEPLDENSERTSRSSDRLRESIRMALVALSLNKLRTALATLGVVIGIASVVTMVAIGEGARRAISEQLSSLGTNLLSVRPINPRTSKGIAGDSFRKFTFEDLDAVKSLQLRVPGIKSVDANVFGSAVVARENKNAMTDLMGANPEVRDMQSYAPVLGRFFTEEENRNRARVVLLGQTVVRNLFGEDQNPVGATIKINRIDFTVIGVLPAKGATAYKDRDDQIILPLHTAMQRVLGKRMFHVITVEMTGQEQAPVVTAELASLLREKRKLAKDQPDDFEIRNMNEIQKIYKQTTGIISSMLAAIATVSLLVGGIGIMNVMLVAVKERTREVGLRKAIGARGRDILSQFLVESALIGLLGGGLGILLGCSLSIGISSAFGWPTVISVGAVAIAFVFSLLVGVFFGLWPARQASELSPIEALRYE